MPERGTIDGDKFIMGDMEFTNLVRLMIRFYNIRNNNRKPKVVIMPTIFEVDGVTIQFPSDEDRQSWELFKAEELNREAEQHALEDAEREVMEADAQREAEEKAKNEASELEPPDTGGAEVEV